MLWQVNLPLLFIIIIMDGFIYGLPKLPVLCTGVRVGDTEYSNMVRSLHKELTEKRERADMRLAEGYFPFIGGHRSNRRLDRAGAVVLFYQTGRIYCVCSIVDFVFQRS